MKKTTRGGKLLAVSLLLLCMMSSLFVTRVFAAGTGKVTLTVRQIFTCAESANPPGKTFAYILTPKAASNPMPSGGANGYDFTITGTGGVSIPLTFTQAGRYVYEISQTTSPQANYAYDRKVYTLEIWVDNSLNAAVVVYNKDGVKVADISFTNTYTGGGEPGTTSKPDTSNPTNPSKPDTSNPGTTNKPSTSNPGTTNKPGTSDPETTGKPEPTTSVNGSEPANAGKPDYTGKPGPVTGDEAQTALYIVLISIAGFAALCSVLYLLSGKRGKEDETNHAQEKSE